MTDWRASTPASTISGVISASSPIGIEVPFRPSVMAPCQVHNRHPSPRRARVTSAPPGRRAAGTAAAAVPAAVARAAYDPVMAADPRPVPGRRDRKRLVGCAVVIVVLVIPVVL